MHTEEEAKKLWCPMARVRSFRWDGDPAYQQQKTCYASGENRGVPKDTANCIASECMMWRKSETVCDDNWVHKGYCGLANRP